MIAEYVPGQGASKTVRVTGVTPSDSEDSIKSLALATAGETRSSVWGVGIVRFPDDPDVVHVRIALD